MTEAEQNLQDIWKKNLVLIFVLRSALANMNRNKATSPDKRL